MTEVEKSKNGPKRKSELLPLVEETAQAFSAFADHVLPAAHTRAAMTSRVLYRVFGFDIWNPLEVRPDPQEAEAEFTDTESGERAAVAVDEVRIDGRPALIVLTRGLNHPEGRGGLDGAGPAERRLLTGRMLDGPRTVEIPVIHTDGVRWSFRVGDAPVLRFDFTSWSRDEVFDLETFCRQTIDSGEAERRTAELKAARRGADWLKRNFEAPGEGLVDLMAAECHDGRRTASVRETYRLAAPKAVRAVMRAVKADRVKTPEEAERREETAESAPRSRLTATVDGEPVDGQTNVGTVRALIVRLYQNRMESVYRETAEDGNHRILRTDPEYFGRSYRQGAWKTPCGGAWLSNTGTRDEAAALAREFAERAARHDPPAAIKTEYSSDAGPPEAGGPAGEEERAEPEKPEEGRDGHSGGKPEEAPEPKVDTSDSAL